jgi:DNA polymerase-3 subunit delta
VDLDALLAEVRAGKASPVYLFHGPERYLADRGAAALADALLEGAPRDFNLDRMDGKGCDAAKLLAVAGSFPMMARRRVVVVRDLDQVPAATLNAIGEYAARPVPTTSLVLVAEKIDLRKKAFQAIRDAGRVIECKKVQARHLLGWVRQIAKAEGRRIDADAVDALARLVGADLARLESEVRKASLLADEGAPITAADVAAVVSDVREESVFDLTDAVAARNPGEALRLLAKMTEGGERALGLVTMIARHLRTLALAHDAVARGAAPSAALVTLGVRDFLIEKYARQLRGFGPGEPARACLAVRDAEFALKSSKLPERLLLETLVLDLCGAKGRG